jgi:hypothetical protein
VRFSICNAVIQNIESVCQPAQEWFGFFVLLSADHMYGQARPHEQTEVRKRILRKTCDTYPSGLPDGWMENVDIFYLNWVGFKGHLVYFMAIRYIFGHSSIFFPFLVCCTKENLATLIQLGNWIHLICLAIIKPPIVGCACLKALTGLNFLAKLTCRNSILQTLQIPK